MGFELFDLQHRLEEISKKGDPLERLSNEVDFESFRVSIERAFDPIDRSKGGRPPFDRVMIFQWTKFIERTILIYFLILGSRELVAVSIADGAFMNDLLSPIQKYIEYPNSNQHALLFIQEVAYFKGDTSKSSSVVLKMNYSSPGLRGYGGKLTLRNIQTDAIYESKSRKGFNPFIIIENVPEGTYEVIELQIIMGTSVVLVRGADVFNYIEIDDAKNYYIGNYMTKKVGPLLRLNIEVSRVSNDVLQKILKRLRKRDTKWLMLKTDFSQKLFKTESTVIKIK